MKGNVESVTTKLSTGRKRINFSEVSITVTIKKNLTYEECERFAEELREEYLGKEVDVDLAPASQRK